MTSDLQRIIESKRAHRRRLAMLPIGEKLRMLDILREREIAIRGRDVPPDSVAFRYLPPRKLGDLSGGGLQPDGSFILRCEPLLRYGEASPSAAPDPTPPPSEIPSRTE